MKSASSAWFHTGPSGACDSGCSAAIRSGRSETGGVMDSAACFASGQDVFHQLQALVVVHLRPAGDLGGGAMATFAQAIVAETANADARTQHGAEGGIHR